MERRLGGWTADDGQGSLAANRAAVSGGGQVQADGFRGLGQSGLGNVSLGL